MKWYLLAFKKYAVISGRSHRQEFWMFVLFNFIFSFGARILDGLLGTNYSDAKPMDGGFISTLYSLVILVPSLSIAVRRLHDIGKSGWVYFWSMFAAIVAFIAYIVFLVTMLIGNGSADLESLRSGDIDPSVFLTGNFITYTALLAIFLLGISVYMIVLLAKRGNVGDNKYGPDPLALPAE